MHARQFCNLFGSQLVGLQAQRLQGMPTGTDKLSDSKIGYQELVGQPENFGKDAAVFQINPDIGISHQH